MPPEKPPHEMRAFNTPEHAQKAVSTSRSCLTNLTPGRVWNHIAPRGEHEMKGALMLDGAPVVVLHFGADGSVLPRGLHAMAGCTEETVSLIEARLRQIPAQLSVLEGAEFREPEFCWAVPLAHEGRIVAHIKVSSDGSRILPDKKAAVE